MKNTTQAKLSNIRLRIEIYIVNSRLPHSKEQSLLKDTIQYITDLSLSKQDMQD